MGALLERLPFSEMTPHEIAMVYNAGVYIVGEHRDRVLDRLAVCQAGGSDGNRSQVSAMVMELELRGSPFSLRFQGQQFSSRPEPEIVERLLPAVLDHPALITAVRSHDAAASMVLSTIGGLNRPDLYAVHREAIMSLADLYVSGAPTRLVLDAQDYLQVVATAAEHASKVESVVDKVIGGAVQVMKSAFNEQSRADAFVLAEHCWQSLRSCSGERQSAIIDQMRVQVLDSGRAALARDRSLLDSSTASDVQEALDRLAGAEARGELVGHKAPPLEFVWASRDGLQSLADLRGKVVVLDFWATNCGPCVASFPNIAKLQEHYKKYQVEIVGITSVQGMHISPDGPVDCRDDPQREMALMPKYMEHMEVTWTVAFTRQSVYNPQYGIRGIPHVVILDPDGIVRFVGLHPADPMAEKAEKINALLREFDLPNPHIERSNNRPRAER